MWNLARRWKGQIGRQLYRFKRTPQLDFVIIGAEKAGTTMLQEVLRATRRVSMPSSEVRYFRDPFYDQPHLLHDEIVRFPAGDLIGIKHPSYLAVPHAADWSCGYQRVPV